jgi:hypothetical protein
LHRVELFRGAGDAAGAGDRGKGLDIAEFHGAVSLWRWLRSQEFIFREC